VDEQAIQVTSDEALEDGAEDSDLGDGEKKKGEGFIGKDIGF
jgi:hypothetical protein